MRLCTAAGIQIKPTLNIVLKKKNNLYREYYKYVSYKKCEQQLRIQI